MADVRDLESFSTYLPMRDGVRIAVQVLGARGFGERKAPVVANFTRYGRATPLAIAGAPFSESLEFTRLGFVVLSVDVRGTGASFGVRARSKGQDELEDCREVFDWAATRDWANGQIFCTGVSYGGNVADMVQALGHPALAAVAPRFTDFDLYEHLLFPGGMPNVLFARLWGQLTAGLDRGQDPDQLNPEARARLAANFVGTDDGTLYRQALAEHAGNPDFAGAMDRMTYRDDFAGVNSPCQLIEQTAAAARPSFHWASWMDAGTAAGALARFQSLDGPMRVRIGAWNHGAREHADPFDQAAPLTEAELREHIEEIAWFFRASASGLKSDQRFIDYRTLGRGGWRRTETWPPASSRETCLWLAEGARLDPTPPSALNLDQSDFYTVDFEHGAGETSRWSTQVGTSVRYSDRRAADLSLLTYTGEPLAEDLEITGTPSVVLHVTPTREDGLVIAYLEVVAPDGAVTYLTEGGLRLIHHATAAKLPVHWRSPANRSFNRADSRAIKPGARLEIAFPLLPTSALLLKGDRIRLAIGGADKDTFARIPADQNAALRLHRSEDAPSRLILPICGT